MISFFHTTISPQAIAYVNQVMRSGWLSEGELVKKFEHELASRLGLSNPVALNSATSGLHLALVLANVKSGDEVILPAQTFVATGLAVLMVGAVPVFADIDPRTGNISTHDIRSRITDRTKAILPVHWGGLPCDMDEIGQIAREHNLTVIEDAAHALGATYRDQVIGTISHFTVFSFQAIKHLTTGDGGALCSICPETARQALVRRWFGIDRANSRPSILGERVYDIEEVGFKYHMNDLAAAVGLGNLEVFSETLDRRQLIGRHYREQLEHVPGLQLLDAPADRTHAYWLFTVLVEEREKFILKLKSEGIPSSVVHLRIDHNSVFGEMRNDLIGQADFNRHQIAVPIHSGLTDDDIEKIVRVIQSGW